MLDFLVTNSFQLTSRTNRFNNRVVVSTGKYALYHYITPLGTVSSSDGEDEPPNPLQNIVALSRTKTGKLLALNSRGLLMTIDGTVVNRHVTSITNAPNTTTIVSYEGEVVRPLDRIAFDHRMYFGGVIDLDVNSPDCICYIRNGAGFIHLGEDVKLVSIGNRAYTRCYILPDCRFVFTDNSGLFTMVEFNGSEDDSPPDITHENRPSRVLSVQSYFYDEIGNISLTECGMLFHNSYPFKLHRKAIAFAVNDHVFVVMYDDGSVEACDDVYERYFADDELGVQSP